MTPLLRAASALLLGIACAGGPSSRLLTQRPGKGTGPVEFYVNNESEVPVNALYIAPTENVDATDSKELDPDSTAGQALWGADQLSGSALSIGQQLAIPIPKAGTWDVMVVDRDGREQIITALRLKAGGRYVLEIHERGWRMP